MADVVKEFVIDTLVPAPTLAVVEGRIWPVSLANVPDPVYPLITFARLVPGTHDYYVDFEEYHLHFGFHSETGYDEAWRLYEATKGLLTSAGGSKAGRAWRIWPASSPFEDVAETGRAVYTIRCRFGVQVTG